MKEFVNGREHQPTLSHSDGSICYHGDDVEVMSRRDFDLYDVATSIG